MSYAFNITDRFTNSLITSIKHKNNPSLLSLTLNGNDGLVPNQAYDLIIEAKNGVGRALSEKISFCKFTYSQSCATTCTSYLPDVLLSDTQLPLVGGC